MRATNAQPRDFERVVTMRWSAVRLLSARLASGLCALMLAGCSVGVEPPPGPGDKSVPAVGLFDGLRQGDLAARAEGSGDGRMVLSVTNRSSRSLRVVLPPGLIASGTTGQFGGGGFGGLGGGGF